MSVEAALDGVSVDKGAGGFDELPGSSLVEKLQAALRAHRWDGRRRQRGTLY